MEQTSNLKKATRTWYDALADQWPEATLETHRDIVNLLNVAPHDTILDAGCANGVRSLGLASLGYQIIGVDLSPEMIRHATHRTRELAIPESNARYVVGDVEQLDLEDASVDAVVCVNVLDFTPYPGRALVEFQRVLQPGGRLLLLMLGAHSAVRFDPGQERWRRFLPDPPPVVPLNDILPWEMEALLIELGWEILDQQPQMGRTLRAPGAGYSEDQVRALPDPVLQQTVATAWQFLASRR